MWGSCLEGVWRLSGRYGEAIWWCGEGVWRVSEGCLKGVGRHMKVVGMVFGWFAKLSGRCSLKGVGRMSEGYGEAV